MYRQIEDASVVGFLCRRWSDSRAASRNVIPADADTDLAVLPVNEYVYDTHLRFSRGRAFRAVSPLGLGADRA
jgi:hypothetical protein